MYRIARQAASRFFMMPGSQFLSLCHLCVFVVKPEITMQRVEVCRSRQAPFWTCRTTDPPKALLKVGYTHLPKFEGA